MRVNLTVPFSENAQVKALGARWDASRKLWYVTDPEDLTPLTRWMGLPDKTPSSKLIERGQGRKKANKKNKDARTFGVTVSNGRWTCACDALPWEDCMHTQTASTTQQVFN